MLHEHAPGAGVQPQFLGRCRTYDDFYYRTVNGFECVERRLGAIGSRYDANVSCSRDDRRIDHSYTLILTDAVSVGTEPDLRSAWANPRLRKITLTSDIVLRACRIGDPIRESAGPDPARRRRAHDPPGLLREAAAAPGRYGLRGAQAT